MSKMLEEARLSAVSDGVATEADQLAELETSLLDVLGNLLTKTQAHRLPSLVPFLPALFRLKGQPYSLDEHFQFEPYFGTDLPQAMVTKSGRQLGKTRSTATRDILIANLIPDYNILVATPLSDQARRISNEHVGYMLEQSPFRDRWLGPGSIRKVWRKQFTNASSIEFSFALIDAERFRSRSADQLSIDESVHWNSEVLVAENDDFVSRPVYLIRANDVVLSFTNRGELCWRRVRRQSYHGRRSCFRIKLRSGHEIVATSESWIATTAGWKRLSQLIEDANNARSASGSADKEADDAGNIDDSAGTDGARNTTRRCVDVLGEVLQESSIQQSPRLEATRVQLDQAPDIVRVRQYGATEAEERRLRRLCVVLHDTDFSGIRVCVSPLSRQQATLCDSTVIAENREDRNLGNAGVVDVRRRLADAEQESKLGSGDFRHARICESRRIHADKLAETSRYRLPGSDCAKKTINKDLSLHSLFGERFGEFHSANSFACSSLHELQGYAAYQTFSGLYLLRSVFPSEDFLARRSSDPVLLQTTSMPCIASSREAKKKTRLGTPEHGESGKKSTLQRFTKSETDSKSGKISQATSEVVRQAQRTSQRVFSQITATQKGSETDSNHSLSSVFGRIPSRNRTEPILQSNLSPDVHAANQATIGVTESEIEKITYAGEHAVYDLEVEGTNTFFANGVAVHNCQDVAWDHLPVMYETLSHSPYALKRYSGTPKTPENTLETLWRKSSQAEWMTPCSACRFENYASIHQHLEKMIGPWRADISDNNPGTICARCRSVINPRFGWWVHRYPELSRDFPGYHIPQPIVQVHYSKKNKWAELLSKRSHYPAPKFMNEVLGESCGAGVQLVTQEELMAAATLPWENRPDDPESILDQLGHYKHIILSVDWGGGGEDGLSLTVITLMGIASNNRISVIWSKRLLTPHDHLGEAEEVLRIFRMSRAKAIAHDYTGAGELRETFLRQRGVPHKRLIPIWYGSMRGDKVMKIKTSRQRPRPYYIIDKARSLLLTCGAIKMQLIKFFKYDFKSVEERGLIHDFLALQENKVERAAGSDVYTIVRNPALTDDFAQTVNIGACALWKLAGGFPDLGEYRALRAAAAELITSLEPEPDDLLDSEDLDEL